jgi:hypothetical protein
LLVFFILLAELVEPETAETALIQGRVHSCYSMAFRGIPVHTRALDASFSIIGIGIAALPLQLQLLALCFARCAAASS